MKKVSLTIAFVIALATPVLAKTVPVPPKRPPAPIFNTDPNVYGAYVKDGQVFVRAPVGSDVQVDVDGTDVDVSVNKEGNFFNKVLPWNWTFWK